VAEPIRTVIVDDEEEVRHLLRVRLERDGGFVVVGEGGDGAEGAAVCVETQPDIVILDAAMPDGDGLASVPDIRLGSPRTIVIIYTSATGVQTRNDAERVGAHAVVGKLDPFDLLLGTIYRFLPDRAPADPVKEDRSQFGRDMASLLEKDEDEGSGRRWSSKTRVWMIVVLVVIVLPVLAFLAWAIGQLAGWGFSI
jgi:DNA-binding NarL/FixJ family response regulator